MAKSVAKGAAKPATKPATKVSSKGSRKVAQVMHEFKQGELESGSTGKTVKDPKQAIAIGLSEARKAEGEKKPHKRGT
jgi:hypothetical protein